MRIVNQSHRLMIDTGDGVVDVEKVSAGKFSSDIQSVYGRWDEFLDWASSADLSSTTPSGLVSSERRFRVRVRCSLSA